MKRICSLRCKVLTTIFLLSGISSFAQPQLSEYYPIGTTWEEVYMTKNGYPGEVVDEPCVFARYKYSVDCDTIIDEKSYKVVNGIMIDYLIKPPGLIPDTTQFYIREIEDSVFIYDTYIKSDRLAYNYNWQEDTSVLLANYNKYDTQYLTFSQEVLLDGNTYDCYNVNNGAQSKKIYKSIGQTLSGIFDYDEDSRYHYGFHLTKFSRDNVLIYENDYPTPQVNAIYDIPYKEKNERQDCYTLQGVKVDVTNLKSGVYIQNGRKYVVK